MPQWQYSKRALFLLEKETYSNTSACSFIFNNFLWTIAFSGECRLTEGQSAGQDFDNCWHWHHKVGTDGGSFPGIILKWYCKFRSTPTQSICLAPLSKISDSTPSHLLAPDRWLTRTAPVDDGLQGFGNSAPLCRPHRPHPFTLQSRKPMEALVPARLPLRASTLSPSSRAVQRRLPA